MAIDERELDDASLVQAAQQGDDEAFAELFRRHYATVRRICARRMGDAGEADEVTQAAFVRAYERIGQCGGDRRFGAWVQVIAYRLATDARRLRSRTLVSVEPVSADRALGPDSCVDAVLRAERAAEVRGVLSGLPPRQREVIVARDLEGRRPGEIAASLGLSLGAVDSLLLRARRRMAAAWQAAAVEHGATSLQVTTGSLVAGTTVGESHPLARWFSAIGSSIDRASVRLAGVLGVVPASSPTAPRLASFVLSGALIATPATLVLRAGPHPGAPPSPGVPELVGGVPPAGPPAAPTVPSPSLPDAPAAPDPPPASPPSIGWSVPSPPPAPVAPPSSSPVALLPAPSAVVTSVGAAGASVVAPVVDSVVSAAGQITGSAVSAVSGVLPTAPVLSAPVVSAPLASAPVPGL